MPIDASSLALQSAPEHPAVASLGSTAAAARPRNVAPLRTGILLLLAAIAVAASAVAERAPYAPGSSLGYALGLAGGSTMLILLLYPIRKHARFMQDWGGLKYWFRLHMVGGILGPLLVLFHSTFRVGSFNAAVALASMLLVVASGLVGRFFYRRVHHGLYGSRATLREAQLYLQEQLAAAQPGLRELPRLRAEVERFTAAAAAEPAGWRGRAVHFVVLGWRRGLAWRRIRRIAASPALRRAGDPASSTGALASLLPAIDRSLRAAQQAAQFSTYERLLALWHVVHIPFLCMLVITAIIHVVAVHAY